MKKSLVLTMIVAVMAMVFMGCPTTPKEEEKKPDTTPTTTVEKVSNTFHWYVKSDQSTDDVPVAGYWEETYECDKGADFATLSYEITTTEAHTGAQFKIETGKTALGIIQFDNATVKVKGTEVNLVPNGDFSAVWSDNYGHEQSFDNVLKVVITSAGADHWDAATGSDAFTLEADTTYVVSIDVKLGE